MYSLLVAVALAAAPLDTVPTLDLARYMGTWHEIARLPARFQEGCTHTTATYALREDGKVEVTNRCRRDGKESVAHGIGKVPDPSQPGKLRVRVGQPFFWGDYQVIALDPDYRWAVVGTPNRKYLWFLSRTPTMAPEDRARAEEAAKAQGFDLSPLLETEQGG